MTGRLRGSKNTTGEFHGPMTLALFTDINPILEEVSASSEPSRRDAQHGCELHLRPMQRRRNADAKTCVPPLLHGDMRAAGLALLPAAVPPLENPCPVKHS